jgi:protease II
VPNYQLFRVEVDKVEDRSAWELFVPARDDVVIEDVDLFHVR